MGAERGRCCCCCCCPRHDCQRRCRPSPPLTSPMLCYRRGPCINTCYRWWSCPTPIQHFKSFAQLTPTPPLQNETLGRTTVAARWMHCRLTTGGGVFLAAVFPGVARRVTHDKLTLLLVFILTRVLLTCAAWAYFSPSGRTSTSYKPTSLTNTESRQVEDLLQVQYHQQPSDAAFTILAPLPYAPKAVRPLVRSTNSVKHASYTFRQK